MVADNGVGLPEDVHPSSTKSLGLRLVRLLSKSLGAVVHVNTQLADGYNGKKPAAAKH